MKDLFVITLFNLIHKLLVQELKQGKNWQFDCTLNQKYIKDELFYSKKKVKSKKLLKTISASWLSYYPGPGTYSFV